MLEHRHQPLLPKAAFLLRVFYYAAAAFGIVLVSLAVGILGYHKFEGLSWTDALVNASMILGGMGPVNTLQTKAGKLFASFYALFSGIVFLIGLGIFLAPIVHRFLHQFHLELDEPDKPAEAHQHNRKQS